MTDGWVRQRQVRQAHPPPGNRLEPAEPLAVAVAVDHFDGALVEAPHGLVVAGLQGIGHAPAEQPHTHGVASVRQGPNEGRKMAKPDARKNGRHKQEHRKALLQKLARLEGERQELEGRQATRHGALTMSETREIDKRLKEVHEERFGDFLDGQATLDPASGVGLRVLLSRR